MIGSTPSKSRSLFDGHHSVTCGLSDEQSGRFTFASDVTRAMLEKRKGSRIGGAFIMGPITEIRLAAH